MPRRAHQHCEKLCDVVDAAFTASLRRRACAKGHETTGSEATKKRERITAAAKHTKTPWRPSGPAWPAQQACWPTSAACYAAI